MSKIILDTSAWIEYFIGSEKGKKIREKIKDSEETLFISGMIAQELCVKFMKEGKQASEVIAMVSMLSKLIPFNYSLAEEGAEIYLVQRKNKSKCSIIDAHIVAAARLMGGKVITCDHDFSGLSEVIIIK